MFEPQLILAKLPFTKDLYLAPSFSTLHKRYNRQLCVYDVINGNIYVLFTVGFHTSTLLGYYVTVLFYFQHLTPTCTVVYGLNL